MKTVLIIAGSDPSAGAGLQQDLKVATILGAYGLTVTTALTIQNTLGVQAVHPVAPEVVGAQLDALLSDFTIHAIKIGMLATAEIVHTVAGRLGSLAASTPLVLDPVLAAGQGQALLASEAIPALKAELFPLTWILTPNVPEASRLTDSEIQTPAQLEEAARRLQKIGPQWVLAKGGHLAGEPIDVLTDGHHAYQLPGRRLSAPHHHGSGCLLATALAAYLAHGLAVPEAVNLSRRLVIQALRWGLPLGQGVGPVNPFASFGRELARYEVLESLQTAAQRLQREDIRPLIPEVMSNLAYATPYPEGPQDVAAFPGRLVKSPDAILIPSPPAFGASPQLAEIILTVMAFQPDLRSAMNCRVVQPLDHLGPLLHLKIDSFEPSQAPTEIKDQDTDILAWGVTKVLNGLKSWEPPPDLIYERADVGKEPQLYILGRNPMEVAEKALALKHALHCTGRLD